MKTANTTCMAVLACHLYRPAIVEARLMTDKHAQNQAYVAALAKELQGIDERLCAMEQAAAIDSRPRPCRLPESGPDAKWIREVSGDLNQRLHRLESQAEAQPQAKTTVRQVKA